MNQKITTLSRLLLGLIFLIFGLNKFLHFIPMPVSEPSFTEAMGYLAHIKYMFYLIGGVEVIAGILLLINRAIPFSLILSAPIVVNIFLIHLFHGISGIQLGAIVSVLTIYLFYVNRNRFKPLLK